MYPTSYAPDGSGRDIGLYNHGTRTSGKAFHVNARDSTVFHPHLQGKRKNPLSSSYFPSAGSQVAGTPRAYTPRQLAPDMDFWSKAAYSSTYREHYSDPAAGNFAARHAAANEVTNLLFGSPAPTPRQVNPMLVKNSTYRADYRGGLDHPQHEQILLLQEREAWDAAADEAAAREAWATARQEEGGGQGRGAAREAWGTARQEEGGGQGRGAAREARAAALQEEAAGSSADAVEAQRPAKGAARSSGASGYGAEEEDEEAAESRPRLPPATPLGRGTYDDEADLAQPAEGGAGF